MKKIEVDLDLSIGSIDKMVEFGGGYGSTCRIAKMNLGLKSLHWDIIDLPIMLSLQRAYLLESCGVNIIDTVSFHDNFRTVNVPKRSMFMATWSISETPLILRREIEPWLKRFDYVFIAFKREYQGIDNFTYFMEYHNLLNKHYVNLIECDMYPGHYYLIASRIEK